MMYLYALLLLIGLSLAGFAMKQYQKTYALLTEGVRTTAIVSGFAQDSEGLEAPEFRFKAKGKTILVQSGIYSSPPAYELNEEVPIVHDANNPREYRVIGYWGLYRWTIILLAIAGPFLVIGGGYFLFRFGG
ncbi:DUF3592 domain-containing protein [Pontibacter sp. G13]|uniref:DUF3592 domain-containing protein n=1 Tax=Pontibacter sp. G13 TaxID=3074898 RepID=UPI00288B43A4|nr:DUF3592 domain-containing protein [Pontibacter sp. G13]WNJ18346.1 DUF3592 domain-containing protein [Pontibacter sp. G13]